MLHTKRLILRPWQTKDYAPFAKMNADPRVREYFSSLLTRQESDEQIDMYQKHIDEKGWGLWAVEVPGVADFIGFIGIQTVTFETPFTPSVEIGWRLAHEYWGKGYAPEGATAALQYAFETLHLPQILAFTPLQNLRSMKVMEKIGMKRDPAHDFDNPRVPDGHHLKRHVLYCITQKEWVKQHGK